MGHEINFVAKGMQPKGPVIHWHWVENVLTGDEHVVGIEYDAGGVRACHVKLVGGEQKVVQTQEVAAPFPVVVDDQIVSPELFVQALRELREKLVVGGLPDRARAAVVARGRDLIWKKITMPLMTCDELDKTMVWDAEQHIPYDINDVVVDYTVVHRRPDQGQMDLVLAAAKRDAIEELRAAFHDAGFAVWAMEPATSAILRTVPGTETRTLIHIGETVTNITVVIEGGPEFSRDIPTGTHDVIQEIQKELGVGWDEASGYFAAPSAPDVPQAIAAIVAHEVQRFVGEICRTLDFCIATSGTGEIGEIVVSGVGAGTPGFAQLLAERVHETVRSAAPHDTHPRYALAVGAALRQDFTPSAWKDAAPRPQPQPKTKAKVRPRKILPFPFGKHTLEVRLATDPCLAVWPGRDRRARISREELARLLEILAFSTETKIVGWDEAFFHLAEDRDHFSRKVRKMFRYIAERIHDGGNWLEHVLLVLRIPPDVAMILERLDKSEVKSSPEVLRACARYLRTGSFGESSATDVPGIILNKKTA